MYFTASLMYVLSVFFEWDSSVALLFKPMILPAIYFYYWQESAFRPTVLSSLALWLFYIGDMILLIENHNVQIPLMLLNLSAYLIVGYYVTKDLLKIKIPELSNFLVLIVSLVTAFLVSLLYVALSLVFNAADPDFGLLTVYGIVLLLLSLEIFAYYLLKNDTSGFFILMTVISLVISDLFYVLYNYYGQFQVFININAICQVASFYFLVKYFLYKNHYNNNLITDEQ
ncbi:hypothetical protein FLJC2902T_24230 [Flavobacterium limnosediminis JC2902]|uniref:YhhN-like protein n=1 Tax=Flavobacterium limnosediminis JC2902 TaxID=1341181 RepID=V6SIP5_9FLAO|nr:hypothetical protein FLJC2902T_24230 [Flavobacterium limnosediminis JC2902]